jgi:hypothetical protein
MGMDNFTFAERKVQRSGSKAKREPAKSKSRHRLGQGA